MADHADRPRGPAIDHPRLVGTSRLRDRAGRPCAAGALRRPVVYEVRSFFEATWSADELERARRAVPAPPRTPRAARCRRPTRSSRSRSRCATTSWPAASTLPATSRCIPNGVDAEAFAPMAPDSGPLALRARRAVRVRVSNLDHPRENQELLVEATARLLARGRKVAPDRGRRQAARRGRAHREVGGGRPGGRVHRARAPRPGPRPLRPAGRVRRPAAGRTRRADRDPAQALRGAGDGRRLVVADLPALTEIAAPDERGLAFKAGDAEALADA